MAPRRLTMRTLLPEDVVLDFTEYPDIAEEWRREYPVRGKLSIEEIGELFNLEGEIKAAITGEDVRAPLERAYDRIMTLIRERTPDVPDIPLGIEEVLGTMAWLAGADSVEDAVVDAIRGKDAEEAAAEDDEPAETTSLGEQHLEREEGAESSAPLASAQPSPRPSSQSESLSTSDPSGGSDAPGERSEDTSPTSAAEAA